MAYDFDGTTATGLASTLIPAAYPVSFSAWVHADSLAAIGAVLTGCSVSTANHLMGIQVGTASSTVGMTLNDGGTALNITGGAPTTGTWLHLGGRFLSGNIALYLNGTQVATSAHTKAFPTIGRIDVGCRQNGSATLTSIIDGRIGEVAWWAGDIGAAGIASLAAGFSPMAIMPGLLVAYYPMQAVLIPQWGSAALTQIGSGSAASSAHSMPNVRLGSGDVEIGTLSLIDGAPALPKPVAAGVLKAVWTITGAGSLPKPIAAGVLKMLEAITGAATLPKPTAAGVLVAKSTIAGAATLPGMTAAGSLVLVTKIAGTASLPGMTAAGAITAKSTIAGAASLPLPVAAGVLSVIEIRTIAGAAVLPLPVAAGVIRFATQIAGAAVLPIPIAEGLLFNPQQAAMGPYEDMHQRVRIDVLSALAAAGLGSVVLWPNEDPKNPDGTPKIPADTLWCEVEDDDIETTMIAIGDTHVYRKRGELRLKVRQPLELGDGEILERIDLLRPFFREKKGGNGVVFGLPYRWEGGRDDDGEPAQWLHTLVCPYHLDDDITRARKQVAVSPSFGPPGESIHNSARGRFAREITQGQSIPTAFDNAAFAPPEGAPWVLFTVQTGRPSFGALIVTPGIAIAAIMWPQNTGTGGLLALVDQIALRFRQVHEAGVTYETPTVRTVRRSGQYFQQNVVIPFRAMEAVS